MKIILTIFLSMAVLLSCSTDSDNGPVLIRISNASSFNFENIIVNTSSKDVIYDDLNAGETSDYKIFEIAYRYAFIEVEIEGEKYRFQPIDYVGETPLTLGRYTYKIKLSDIQKEYYELGLELIKN